MIFICFYQRSLLFKHRILYFIPANCLSHVKPGSFPFPVFNFSELIIFLDSPCTGSMFLSPNPRGDKYLQLFLPTTLIVLILVSFKKKKKCYNQKLNYSMLYIPKQEAKTFQVFWVTLNFEDLGSPFCFPIHKTDEIFTISSFRTNSLKMACYFECFYSGHRKVTPKTLLFKLFQTVPWRKERPKISYYI